MARMLWKKIMLKFAFYDASDEVQYFFDFTKGKLDTGTPLDILNTSLP